MKIWLPFLSLIAAAIVCGQDAPPPGVAVEPPSEVPGAPGVTPAPDQTASGTPEPATPGAPVAAAPKEDKAIPQAYSEEHYAATWARNPFLIETKVTTTNPGPGFAEDWELKAVIRSKGQPEAFLSNKKTQETRWVKTTEDKDGFKILEANIDRDVHKSSVKVAKTGEREPATFTFPEVAAAPGAGARPGMPPIPQPQGATNRTFPTPNNPTQPRPGIVPNGAVQARPGGVVTNGAQVQQPGGMPNGMPGQNNTIRTLPQNTFKVQGGVQIPPQPTNGGRRRVLIPPSPATTPGS